MRPIVLIPSLLLFAVSLAGQECPTTPEEQRRVAYELLQLPSLRPIVAEGRARVLRVYCTERDKERPQPVLVAVIYNYSTNVPLRVTVDPASRQLISSDRINERPQTSAEERAEAFALVRKNLQLNTETPLEGGFVVDPPQGTPPAGRYVVVQVLSQDRWKLVETVTVDLSRGTIAARRRQ
jgi:hypothetical protein